MPSPKPGKFPPKMPKGGSVLDMCDNDYVKIRKDTFDKMERENYINKEIIRRIDEERIRNHERTLASLEERRMIMESYQNRLTKMEAQLDRILDIISGIYIKPQYSYQINANDGVEKEE